MFEPEVGKIADQEPRSAHGNTPRGVSTQFLRCFPEGGTCPCACHVHIVGLVAFRGVYGPLRRMDKQQINGSERVFEPKKKTCVRTDPPYCVKHTPPGETYHSGSPSRAKKWRWERDTRRCFCCVPPGTRYQVPGMHHEIMRKEHISPNFSPERSGFQTTFGRGQHKCPLHLKHHYRVSWATNHHDR